MSGRMRRDGGAAVARQAAFLGRLGATAAGAFGRAGVITPVGPGTLAGMAGAVLRGGLTPATGLGVMAARYPQRAAIIDERGTQTYQELQERIEGLAAALHREYGLGRRHRIGVMCRNHRGFVEAMMAGSRLGGDVVLLNTEFAGPQVAAVTANEGVDAVVIDEEFWPAFQVASFRGPIVIAWHDSVVSDAVTIDELVTRPAKPAPRPLRPGRATLLTSGTTGMPKGAPRKPSAVALMAPATGLVERVPMKARRPVLIAPPLFHALGFAFMGFAILLASPIVLRRRFDTEQVLADVERHHVGSLVAVPLMLQRLADLPQRTRMQYDTSSLRVAVSGGSALLGATSDTFMDVYGEVLYNLYGSTECGWAGIATPAELRTCPGTVGRPPFGTSVVILDDEGDPVPQGGTGRIFVGGSMHFEGCTGGGNKEVVGSFMSTGDVGHVDEGGRLFVEGRDDDMIVSGGENVFPQEIEELLAAHPAVADVAVVGVPDEAFGQRLAAFVVTRPEVPVSAEQLQGYVKEHLARYKVPRDVTFLEELPRNATGKVLRRVLAEGAGAGKD